MDPLWVLLGAVSLINAFAVYLLRIQEQSRIRSLDSEAKIEILERKVDSIRLSQNRRIQALEEGGDGALNQFLIQQLQNNSHEDFEEM